MERETGMRERSRSGSGWEERPGLERSAGIRESEVGKESGWESERGGK